MTVSARLGEANAALNFNTYNLRRALCRTAFELRALAVAALIGATTQRNAGIVVLRATTEIPKVLIGYQEKRARSSPMGGQSHIEPLYPGRRFRSAPLPFRGRTNQFEPRKLIVKFR